jgi:uncharacterized coiled-coil protein SlyX
MDEDDEMKEKSENMDETEEKSYGMEDEEEEDEKSYKDKKSDDSDVEADEEVSKADDVAAAVAELKDGITSAFSDLSTVIKSLNDQIVELKKSVGMVDAKLVDAEQGFNNLGKRIDAVEADTAFQKSGDLGEIVQEQPEMVEKSLWGGRFLK